ncbi:hypothetical protein R50072_03680 [Simiduia litorea]|uniref:lytic polysaccharide monooxygenase n=1 Tax=Simiduia litorea TaxID=1435348 RepID=UPI0036F37830
MYSQIRKGLLSSAVIITSLGVSSMAVGHGLMVDPPARNAKCGLQEKPDQATTPACVDAFANDANGGYQFMSVLSHDVGRKGVTPLPGNVCGFDSEVWNGGATPWDTATNWPTTPVVAGEKVFTWNISWGPHFDDTEEFRYWITKPGFVFDPNKKLTWDDFETEAFCALNYDDKNPNANPLVVADKANTSFHTTCQLPARSGHHVVYGEWGRNYFTYERFHGCMDLSYSAGPTPPSAQNQSVTLEKNGSAAITLVATDADGQVVDYTLTSQPAHGVVTGTGASRVYTPDVNYSGVDSFAFVAIDNDNLNSAPAVVSITVKAENSAPVASFMSSSNGLEATLHAHDSSDPDGDTLSYAWSFGDGNVGQGVHVVHAYAVPGTYDVSLTVSDGSLNSTLQKPVTVSALPSSDISCEYVVENEWSTGAVATIRINNRGASAVNDWTVGWQYSNGNRVASSWNATLTGANPYQATALSWNKNIPSGQTASFGVQITKAAGETAVQPDFVGGVCAPN